MAKKPLTFSLDQPAAATLPRSGATVTAVAEPKAKAGESMKQVGARIPESLYRQLKAHAALSGERVQTLLEAAVSEYLQRHAG